MRFIFCAAVCLGAFAPLFAFDIVYQRGDTQRAPANTVEAFKRAWEAGARMVECDVRVTKTDKLVCIDSEDALKSMFGGKKISELTDADLAGVDLAATKRWRKRFVNPVGIPTLDRVLGTVPADGALFVELRGYDKKLPARLDAYRDAAGLRKRQIRVTSSHPKGEHLRDFNARMPGYLTLWVFALDADDNTGALSPPAQSVIAVCNYAGAKGVVVGGESRALSPAYVAALKRAGLLVYAFAECSQSDVAFLKSLGADGVYTACDDTVSELANPDAK